MGQRRFEGSVGRIELEALPEGGDAVSETAEADMGGAEAAVALSPVGIELDGLLGVGEGVGVAVEGGVGGGAVGVEEVVGGGEVDGLVEEVDDDVELAGGEGVVASSFGLLGMFLFIVIDSHYNMLHF